MASAHKLCLQIHELGMRRAVTLLFSNINTTALNPVEYFQLDFTSYVFW